MNWSKHKKVLFVAILCGLYIFGVDLEKAEAEWVYGESKDELTGKINQRHVVAYSENKVEGWISKRKVLLGVVCGEKDPYLRTNDISLTGSIDCTEYGCTTKQRMRFKFDNVSEALTVTAYVWEHSNGASFSSGELIRLMKPAGSVKVEFEPILTQGKKVIAHFSLIGFSKALSKCKNG